MAGGRPTKYTPELLERAREYLEFYEELGDLVPSIVGLCLHLDIDRSTGYDWAEDKNKEEFSNIFRKCEDKQHQKLINGGLSGAFNPAITKMMMTKHGYSDKQEIDHKSGDGSMSPNRVEIVAPESK